VERAPPPDQRSNRATAGPYREVAVIEATAASRRFHYLGAGVRFWSAWPWLDRNNLGLRGKEFWAFIAALLFDRIGDDAHRVSSRQLGK